MPPIIIFYVSKYLVDGLKILAGPAHWSQSSLHGSGFDPFICEKFSPTHTPSPNFGEFSRSSPGLEKKALSHEGLPRRWLRGPRRRHERHHKKGFYPQAGRSFDAGTSLARGGGVG